MGAHASKLHDALIDSQSQTIPFADTDLEPICSFQFLQPQGRVAEILKKQAQLFIDAFPDVGGESLVIPENGILSSKVLDLIPVAVLLHFQSILSSGHSGSHSEKVLTFSEWLLKRQGRRYYDL